MRREKLTGQTPVPQTKTFMEYEELEMYDSYMLTVEVPTRDVKQIDFKALDEKLWFGAAGIPSNFRFFDADVTVVDGREVLSNARNFSPEYRLAETVMTLDDYKKREAPKLAAEKERTTNMFGRFVEGFLDGGFSLTRAFREAAQWRRPVKDWYIRRVEATIAEAEQKGITHVALWDDHPATTPLLVTKDMIVLDKTLNQLYPAAERPKTTPAPSP